MSLPQQQQHANQVIQCNGQGISKAPPNTQHSEIGVAGEFLAATCKELLSYLTIKLYKKKLFHHQLAIHRHINFLPGTMHLPPQQVDDHLININFQTYTFLSL